LGLQIAERYAEGFTLRADSYAQRFIVTSGPSDDVSVIGWEVDDDGALSRIAAKLRAAGVEVADGTREEAAARKGTRLIKFHDPAGNPSELAWGAEIAKEPFASKVVRSGFVTGDQGLGHIVVSSIDPQKSKDFYSALLGFRYSDRIAGEIHGFKFDIS